VQLWFAHGGEVSIREQLVTQVVLGILSDDLPSGQRLPSTRELARRFHLHPNTVSAGYRQLERERWVEFRHGSGVYVRETKPEAVLSAALALDQMIANLFRSARELGVPLAGVHSRIRQWLDMQPPDHFLLIEPDEELRRIVSTEMQLAVTFPIRSCDSLDEDELGTATRGAIVVTLPSKARAVRQALRSGADLLTLQVRSVPSSLADWLPAPSSTLVGIASRWDNFLQMARTFLIAAGFESDTLIFRDAKKPGWQRGLEQAAAVVCDSVTATNLSTIARIIPFQLLSESSLVELRRYEQFVRSPLGL
jgi:DNA-binding transcriptional regulator YhcF (GntR family)